VAQARPFLHAGVLYLAQARFSSPSESLGCIYTLEVQNCRAAKDFGRGVHLCCRAATRSITQIIFFLLLL